MSWCSSVSQSSGFVSSMVGYIDCQADRLGSAPYQALSAPGSTLSVVLTGFLTIYIALIGYNLLLGRSLTVRSGTLAAVKIGAVFALATSWAAYQVVAYDLVTDAPAQIVSEIGSPAALPGADGTLLQRLDLADDAFVKLANLGSGGFTERDDVPPPPFAGFNAFALGGSRILFLLTVIAGLGSVHILAGIMLAVGPFFIAFLMFDSTRSLFEGWIRVLAGATLGTVGLALTLGLMLSFLEPWLAGVLARRMAGEALPSVPTELLVITCLFAIVAAVVVSGCVWLARAFRLAPISVHVERSAGAAIDMAGRQQTLGWSASQAQAERTRAQAMVDVLVSNQHREVGEKGLVGGSRTVVFGPGTVGASIVGRQVQIPVGRSFRRARARTSASAGRRDTQ